jgi:hypothetical protein
MQFGLPHGEFTKMKVLICLFLFTLAIGCSSSEPRSVVDGASQEQIDEYNALIEKEAKLAAETPALKPGE